MTLFDFLIAVGYFSIISGFIGYCIGMHMTYVRLIDRLESAEDQVNRLKAVLRLHGEEVERRKWMS